MVESYIAQDRGPEGRQPAEGTTADILIETIADWGVEVIFGFPGDGINGIMEALRTHQNRVRFIQVRHEEAAAFMACAYAKFTGRLGVCLATSGPGGIHLLNGLYDAKLDGQPVLAITGHTYHDLIGTHYQQDVDLDKLFMDVAVYNERINSPNHARNVTELACRTALGQRGVAHVTIPSDVQEWKLGETSRSSMNVKGHTSNVYAFRAGLPPSDEVQRAADILNAGEKVTILAGRGAEGCGDLLEEFAELLAAPIVKPLLGKDVVPDLSPYTTGGTGLLGTKPSSDALAGCDTLLIVGTSFPYMSFYPKPGAAKAIQIDIDAARIGLRYPVDVGLLADSKATLQALRPLLRRKQNRTFLEKAQSEMRDWLKLMEQRGTSTDMPMKPEVVAYSLNKFLRDDAIISSDSGTIATWSARHIMIRKGQRFSLSGNLATMANGLPYSIAAQIAYPERQCVAFVGDGGFTMLMGEFATAVKYKLPIKVVIIKNNVLGQIKWEQMVFLGNPQFGVELEPIDFVRYAEACGGVGFRIDDPQRADALMQQALNTPGPVLIEAVVDPNEPPMPPDVSFEQIKHMAEALLHNQPNKTRIATTLFRDKITDFLVSSGDESGIVGTIKEKARDVLGLDDDKGPRR
ncbi:MAG: thiamine pyrophosphate-dependent enzyme [Dehalococcoidia bacterium]